MKRCTSCGRRKPLRAFSRWGRAYGGKRKPECKACLVERERRRAEASRQWILDYAAGWRGRNRRLIDSANCFVSRAGRSSGLTTYYRLRHEAILAYGGYRCACCGIEEPLFLTIDHVHNGGARHRRQVGVASGFYRWLKERSYPAGFQVLCSNCNSGRHRNRGICPHKDPARNGRRHQPVRQSHAIRVSVK
jgi:hypothetical protein